MSEEEEFAVVEALGDRDLALVAVGEHFEALVVHHRVDIYVGVAAHRDIDDVVRALEQQFVVVAAARRIDAEQLALQVVLVDAVVEFERRLRTPADIDRRGDVGLGELHDLFQLFPIGDLLERQRLDGGACDDHAVEVAVLDLVELLVKFLHMRERRIFAFIGARVDKRHIYLKRRVAQEPEQLCLGLHLCRHQIDDRDVDRADVLRPRAMGVHHEDVLFGQLVVRGQFFGNDYRHRLPPPLTAAARPTPV